MGLLLPCTYFATGDVSGCREPFKCACKLHQYTIFGESRVSRDESFTTSGIKPCLTLPPPVQVGGRAAGGGGLADEAVALNTFDLCSLGGVLSMSVS